MSKYIIGIVLCFLLVSAIYAVHAVHAAATGEIIKNDDYSFVVNVPESWIGRYEVKSKEIDSDVLYSLAFDYLAGTSKLFLMSINVTHRDNNSADGIGELYSHNERYSFYIKTGEASGAPQLREYDKMLAELSDIQALFKILPAQLKGYYTNKEYDFSIKLPTVWSNTDRAVFTDSGARMAGVQYACTLKYRVDESWLDLFTINVISNDKARNPNSNLGSYLGKNKHYSYYLLVDKTHSFPAEVVSPLELDVFASNFNAHYIASAVGSPILANNTPVNGEIIKRNGASFLPLRAICDAFGYSVSWSESAKSITVSGDGKYSRIFIGDVKCFLDKQSTKTTRIAFAPFIQDGVTYICADFFEDVLGLTVHTTVNGEQIIE